MKSILNLILSATIIGFTIFTYAQTSVDSPFGFHPALIVQTGYPNNGYGDAQNIGVLWTRPSVYAFWFLIQPDLNEDVYDFSMHDRMYGEVPPGMHILANVAHQSNHRDEGRSTDDPYIPIDSLKYVQFVKATVERYDGDGVDDYHGLAHPILHWQVGNEPLALHEGKSTGFAHLQRMTYMAIKEACPECQVLMAGCMQPALPGVGFVVEPDDYFDWFSTFFEPFLSQLNGEYADILDFHWYGDAVGDYRKFSAIYDSLHQILAKYKFSEKPIWITEMGSYSGDPVGPLDEYQTEAQQAGDYMKRYIYPLSIGIDKVFPAFGLMEGFQNDDGYFDHTGLLYNGQGSNDLGLGVRKLGYYSYKLMTEKLEGCDWDGIETIVDGEDHVTIFKLSRQGEPIWVAWWDWFDDPEYGTGARKAVQIQVDAFDSVIVTAGVPDVENGLTIIETDYPEFFPTKQLKTVDGVVSIQLGENPVFIDGVETPTALKEKTGSAMFSHVQLFQNYPNPFNPETTIPFYVPEPGRVIIHLFDLQGREIATVIDASLEAGSHRIVFDGSHFSSGIYYYQLQVGHSRQTRRCILLK